MAEREVIWARAMLWGVAAMVGPALFGILLRLSGYFGLSDPQMSDGDIFVLVVFVLAVIPAVVVPMIALDRIWLVIIAICLLPIVPFAVAVITTVQPFGPIHAVALAEARPPGVLATGIRITDAAPRRDLARSVVFAVSRPSRRGSTSTTYQYQVAPVVNAQWVTGMPVAVWAVVEGTARDPHWDAEGGTLFRPIDIALAERAVRRAGLPAVAAPVIGLWVADARAARLAQVTDWALLLGGASLAWALLASVGLRRKPRPGRVRADQATPVAGPRSKRRPR